MCEPVSLTTLMAASLAMSTATGVVSYLGQQQQESANRHNAEASFALQNQQTNLGIQQGEASDSLKAQQSQVEMLKAAATAKATAGATGTSGNSVDALIGDYHASEGRYLNSLSTQGVMDRQQAGIEKLGQAATAQRQINSVPKPNFLGAALRIGADSLNNYTNIYGKYATK